MKTIKIEKEVTKEDVFVCVANASEYDEVCRIIIAGGEQILKRPFERLVTYSPLTGCWVAAGSMGDKYQITIPQLAELLGVEYPLKPKFEAGKWYIAEVGTNIFCHNGKFDEDGAPCGYGVACDTNWWVADDVGWGGDYREATPSEVEKALVAEAKRRFKSGVEINNSSLGFRDNWQKIEGGNIDWGSGYLYFGNRGTAIFYDGKWAEVREEEKKLPTLEELITEAKSKITVKTESYPCWVEGTREIEVYHIGGTKYMTEKLAIIGYIAERLREEYL